MNAGKPLRIGVPLTEHPTRWSNRLPVRMFQYRYYGGVGLCPGGRFDDPIVLPDGRRLVTLQDAGTYITKLPKAEHTAPDWQAAMEALIVVVTLGGPTMFARIGMMRALNRHVERVLDRSRKDTHWGKRKLKRDE
jgi:hypothetical protein